MILIMKRPAENDDVYSNKPVLMRKVTEADVMTIKQIYLPESSQNPSKRKRFMKPSDKFRFSFDWDNTDDTSSQTDHQEAPLLFGRGFRAGIDRREQKNKHSSVRKVCSQHHWSDKVIDEMTERDWRIFKEDFGISYKGNYKASHPMRSWSESGLGHELIKAIDKAGYEKPSPIQMAAIPLGLRQRDVIGVSQTGSGKTAAFVLPMLSYINRISDRNCGKSEWGPFAVVLAPTHELAQQIEHETVKLGRFLGIKVVLIVGGQSIEDQGFKISQGCDIVIATPGRLLDCLQRHYIVLNHCNYVVLDEADRMIDMGFEPQVLGVLDAMPSSNLKPINKDLDDDEGSEKRIYRTTYMFSATMPPSVERLARNYLRNPVVVTIGTAGKPTNLIIQKVIMVKESEKFPMLRKMLDVDTTAIVFVNTKASADTLREKLYKSGYCVTTLHGDKFPQDRESSLVKFREKKYTVMVATDALARGIDVPDVPQVINYDMPRNIENYTHRVGRTGRAGKMGVATTFLTSGDTNVFYDLKQILIQSNSHVPRELDRHEASKFKPGTFIDRPKRQYGTVNGY